MFTTIDRVLGVLERLFQTLTAVFIGALTLFVSWETFARFVLHSGQFWSQEASLITMTWIGLLGAAAAVWSEGHISLTLIVDRLPPAGRRTFRALSDLAVAGFSFVLLLTGITLVKGTMGGTWASIPVAIGYTNLVVPASAAIMCLFSFVRFVRRIAGGDAKPAGQEG